jgi:hypothetical protein
VGDSLEKEEERLRAAIRSDTEGLRQAVDTLQTVARRRVSARNSIRQHPIPWLTGALVFGWMVGSRLR